VAREDIPASSICSICLEEMESNQDPLMESGQTQEYTKTFCGHYFHSKCLKKWLELSSICPNCRKIIPDV